METPPATTEALDEQLRSAIAANPLDALVRITGIRTLLADRERDAVRRSLENHTWAEIGSALGVSKQAAFQRFGKQWVMETKAEMKAVGGSGAKRAFGEKLRRALK